MGSMLDTMSSFSGSTYSRTKPSATAPFLALSKLAGWRLFLMDGISHELACHKNVHREKDGLQRQNSACVAHVDEALAASVPTKCPDCGGAVDVTGAAAQYQEDLPPVRPVVRRFDIEVGLCSQCRRRIQG
ncbi:MAG: IS66 family transposase zinc-finger binding domain-containing protein, partial [Rhodospirillaceae bacterium]|nr:IS66 family transposase zinc-finger binding domain-containing protein [Rhodospirillaceae bacterium]